MSAGGGGNADAHSLSLSIGLWFHLPVEETLRRPEGASLLDGMLVAERPAVRGRAAP